MQHILWLPRWYPNKLDRFAGDFIQRHALAASLHFRVRVIHLVRDREGVITRSIHRDFKVTGNLEEEIIYYHSFPVSLSVADKLFSSIRYTTNYKQAIRNYIGKNGVPALCHIHVLEKNGYFGLWLKRKYGVPLIVSEQWVIYLREAKPGFNDLPGIIRRLNNKVIRESSGVSVVSKWLGDALANLNQQKPYAVIPNVVDEKIFYPGKKAADQNLTRFIHISTLNYQKNPEAILEAFEIVKKTNRSFQLQIFGPSVPSLVQYCEELGLTDQVIFFSEVPQTQLAGYVRNADALILYSRYETFGCVIIEANACGVPVIASDIPVHHETITEGKNGYFVEGENPAALAGLLLSFMEKHPTAHPGMSADTLQKYGIEKIGEMFKEFYAKAIS